MIFDGPSLKGNFKRRLKQLEKILGECENKYVKLHDHETCKGHDHLESEMKRVIKLEGEGMMLRNPSSAYEYRRSDQMLKVKEFHDAEATVIGKEKGTGRCSNMMGALIVQKEDGVVFKIGSGFTDA